MTRWLVTGAGGMLGRGLTGLLPARGEQVTDQAAVLATGLRRT